MRRHKGVLVCLFATADLVQRGHPEEGDLREGDGRNQVTKAFVVVAINSRVVTIQVVWDLLEVTLGRVGIEAPVLQVSLRCDLLLIGVVTDNEAGEILRSLPSALDIPMDIPVI